MNQKYGKYSGTFKTMLGSSKKRRMTIRHYACSNFCSFLLRFLLISTVFCLALWLFFKLNFVSFNQSSPIDSMNFTMTFSNVQMEYSMKIPLDEPCKGKEIKLLALVMSRRETEEKRQGIRRSWAKEPPEGIIVRFLIGNPTEEENNKTAMELRLQNEQQKYGDLIRYSIDDGYANLHWKNDSKVSGAILNGNRIFPTFLNSQFSTQMSAAFQWQQTFCPNAEFVMKTDDDTIVDLGRWEFWVEHKFKKDLERTNNLAFFGYLFKNSRPIRQKDNKWYVSVEDFPGIRYPDYMQGVTYFGTGDAIRAVMAKTNEVRGFNMDDIVFTGIAAEKANVSRIDYKFKHFRGDHSLNPNEPCEQGEPTVFALYKTFTKVEEYERAYADLHALKCKI